MKLQLLTCLIICSIFLFGQSAQDITLLKPTKTSGQQIGLVYIHGAQCKASTYVELMKHIQEKSDNELFVAIPSFALDTPNPIAVKSQVKKSIELFKQNGFEGDKIFLAGHSLGGVFTQDYAFNNYKEFAGLLLNGSFIQSKYRTEDIYQDYPLPTLTLNGELDGLVRLSKTGESAYIAQQKNLYSPENYPVIALAGLNHISFTDGTDIPIFVRINDMIAEISQQQAFEEVSSIMSAFMDNQVDPSSDSQEIIVQYQEKSGPFLNPQIDALLMEGSHKINNPCNSDHPSPQCPYYPAYPAQDDRTPSENTKCFCGTPVTEKISQPIMSKGNFTDLEINVVDAVHNVNDVKPIHLPHIFNECGVSDRSCVLNATTVSQQFYEDSLDTGLQYISAYEIRTKLTSRQRNWQKHGIDASLEDSDETSDICQDINQAILDWALNEITDDQLERYDKYGEKMVMGPSNGPLNAGPLWINKKMEYNQEVTPEGEKFLEVKSAYNLTPVNYFIPSAAGYHYCKVLSPARAMEWITYDSIKKERNIQNKDKLEVIFE